MSKSKIISVQASAGSGKTYNLAKRYIFLLLNSENDIEIKNIIAVTFTNKAAVEMKYRVIDYLKKAALMESLGDFFNDLKLSKEEIAKRSSKVLKTILSRYDNFNISTIDSFKNRILKACAMSIDISPNFTVERDYSDDLDFALENFLQRTLFSDSLKNIMLKYIDQYLMKDVDWLPKEGIYREIEKIFEKSGNSGKDILYSDDINFRNEILSIAESIVKKIRELSKLIAELKIKISKHYSNAVDKVLKTGAKLFMSVNDIPKSFKNEGLKYLKDSPVSAKAEQVWNEIHNDICCLCDFYVENYYDIYSKIYSEVICEFDNQSKKAGIVYLNEINKKTVNYFENNNDIMPEIYYRLSEKYKHFLIDEFQDTSLVQWAGVKRFLEESLASGGSFFYVGDVKQFLYSFRGSKAELFNMASEAFPCADIERIILDKNYRSRKIIVDFNNKIFSKENISRFFNFFCEKEEIERDFTKLIEIYASSWQDAQKDGGYIEINTINKACDDIEEEIKQKLLEVVAQVVERFSLKDIAVLCRTNEEILKISLWLLENGYEIESPQTLNIKNNSVIRQIISLLMFINSPVDTLAFSSFLLGDIFSEVSGIPSEEMENFVFSCKSNVKAKILYKAFSEKYKDLWEKYFEEFFVKAGFVPVYELTLSILEKFKITNFTESKIFVMRFLELIKDFETKKTGLKNLFAYFQKLDDDNGELYIKNSFGAGIKIMTVHKSKGLEFPVVIVPYLRLSCKRIENPYFDDSNEKIKLLNITEKNSEFSQEARERYEAKKLKSLFGELNVLYVSMTRSECEFYGIIPPKAESSNNLIPALFGGENFLIGIKEKNENSSSNKKDFMTDECDFLEYKGIDKHYIRSKSIDFNVTQERIKGNMIHYALSKIITLKGQNINNVIKNVVSFSERKFPFEDTIFLENKLKKIFSSKEILEMFSYDKDKVFNEKGIINSFGESFRIDKFIVDSDRFIILDFKSSNYDLEKDKKQIENYVSLVSEIYADKRAYAYIVNIENNSLVKICPQE